AGSGLAGERAGLVPPWLGWSVGFGSGDQDVEGDGAAAGGGGPAGGEPGAAGAVEAAVGGPTCPLPVRVGWGWGEGDGLPVVRDGPGGAGEGQDEAACLDGAGGDGGAERGRAEGVGVADPAGQLVAGSEAGVES